jgi:hypothetical protein
MNSKEPVIDLKNENVQVCKYYIKGENLKSFLEIAEISVTDLSAKTKIPQEKLEKLLSGELDVKEHEFRSIAISYCPEAPLPVESFIELR